LIGVLLSFTGRGGGGVGGWGHDLFVMEARKGALHRLFKQRAVELQASVNFLLLVYITCCLLIIITQTMHALQGRYSRVDMPSSWV
jgi:hypothetical protein